MNQVRSGIYTGRRFQYGNGLFYKGVRYQKGNGFFGRVLKNAVWPLLKYLGKQGLKTAIAIGGEAAKNPSSSFKEIAKEKLKEVGIQALDDGTERVKKYIQTGSGLQNSEGVKGVKRGQMLLKDPLPRKKIKTYPWLTN